jgi:hypothetical protein
MPGASLIALRHVTRLTRMAGVAWPIGPSGMFGFRRFSVHGYPIHSHAAAHSEARGPALARQGARHRFGGRRYGWGGGVHARPI